MANRLVKSLFWLVSCSALGFGLLTYCTQEDSITNLRKELPGIERDPIERVKKNQQFVNILQTAADSKEPLYRLNKQQLDKELKKP